MSTLFNKISNAIEEKATKYGIMGTENVSVTLTLTDDEVANELEGTIDNELNNEHYAWEREGNELIVTYTEDVKTNQVPSAHKGTKDSRTMAAYDGFKGGATVAHVKKLVGKELASRLTGHELGLVMSAVNRAWHEAKASMGAEMIDSNCVWIKSLDKGIEWTEVGAEYKQVTEVVTSEFSPPYKSTKSVKVKDGEFIPKFVEK